MNAKFRNILFMWDPENLPGRHHMGLAVVISYYVAPGDNMTTHREAARVKCNSFGAGRKLRGHLVRPATRYVMDICNFWAFQGRISFRAFPPGQF